MYGTGCEFIVEIIYLKTIVLQQHEDQLKAFCRYIFEDVFDHFNAKSDCTLQFDLENSPFQLLPCLLTRKFIPLPISSIFILE